jgi:uncharacterized protein YqeY
MSLKDDITADMKAALKAKDSARLGSIRLLQAAIQRKEVDERIELDDAQVLAVVEKLVKQSRDAIGQFQDAGRQELADKELADVAVWQKYLPEQLSDEEIDALVTDALEQTGANSMKDMGKVMGVLKPKLQGKADMGQVSARIKAALSG